MESAFVIMVNRKEGQMKFKHEFYNLLDNLCISNEDIAAEAHGEAEMFGEPGKDEKYVVRSTKRLIYDRLCDLGFERDTAEYIAKAAYQYAKE